MIGEKGERQPEGCLWSEDAEATRVRGSVTTAASQGTAGACAAKGGLAAEVVELIKHQAFGQDLFRDSKHTDRWIFCTGIDEDEHGGEACGKKEPAKR